MGSCSWRIVALAPVVRMAKVRTSFPFGPFHHSQTSAKASGKFVPEGNGVGLLALRPSLPLVESVGRHQAAPLSQGVLEHGRGGSGSERALTGCARPLRSLLHDGNRPQRSKSSRRSPVSG